MSSTTGLRRRVGRTVTEETHEEANEVEVVAENGHAEPEVSADAEHFEPAQPARRPRTRMTSDEDEEDATTSKPASAGPAKRPTPKRVASARPEAAKSVARPTPLRKLPPPSGPAKKKVNAIEQTLADIKELVKGLTKEYLVKLEEEIDAAGGTNSDLYKSFTEVKDTIDEVCTMSYGKDEIIVGTDAMLAILGDENLKLGNKFTKVEKDVVETDEPITYSSFESVVEDEDGSVIYIRKSSVNALAALILQYNGTPVTKSNTKGTVAKQQHYKLDSKLAHHFTAAKKASTKSSSAKSASTVDLNCISSTGLAKLLLKYTYAYDQADVHTRDRDLFDAIEKNVDSDGDLLVSARDGPKKIKKQQDAKSKKTASQ